MAVSIQLLPGDAPIDTLCKTVDVINEVQADPEIKGPSSSEGARVIPEGAANAGTKVRMCQRRQSRLQALSSSMFRQISSVTLNLRSSDCLPLRHRTPSSVRRQVERACEIA